MNGHTTWFLVIDDEERDRLALVDLIVAQDDWRVVSCASWADWMDKKDSHRIDIAIIDWKLADGVRGNVVAERLRKEDPSIATFLLTSEGVRAIDKSIESRLFDTWLEKEFGRDPWEGFFISHCRVLESLVRERRVRRASERRVLPLSSEIDALVSQLVPELHAIAESRMPVLILGESGTGKESVARAIHEASGVIGDCYPVNCASFEGDLAMSALFGHQRGAFSGAATNHPGAILSAAGVRPTGDAKQQFLSWLRTSPLKPDEVDEPSPHGPTRRLARFGTGMTGTLFLDEVADLPPQSQALLLRFLDDSGFHPVGYTGTPLAPRVRIIAATSQRGKMIGKGANAVRRDLYFRLAGWVVQLPPLHERPDDGVAVAESVLGRELNKKLSWEARALLRERLAARDGPFRAGNLRSLIWCVKRAAWLSRSAPNISAEAVRDAAQERYAGPVFDVAQLSERSPAPDLKQLVGLLAGSTVVEPKHIVLALEQTLAAKTFQRQPLKRWLDEPQKILNVQNFRPSSHPWGLWFVVGLLRAVGSSFSWASAKEIMEVANDPKPSLKLLRDTLAKADVSIADSATDLKQLLRVLHASESLPLDPMRELLPPPPPE